MYNSYTYIGIQYICTLAYQSNVYIMLYILFTINHTIVLHRFVFQYNYASKCTIVIMTQLIFVCQEILQFITVMQNINHIISKNLILPKYPDYLIYSNAIAKKCGRNIIIHNYLNKKVYFENSLVNKIITIPSTNKKQLTKQCDVIVLFGNQQGINKNKFSKELCIAKKLN